MDERTLNDLLECSVCLERLDTSSKVLPCQHTFCRKCLEVILTSRHELRCPECRILVNTKIDELPPNVLLMRILEGMKNTAAAKTLQQQQEEHETEKIQNDSVEGAKPLNEEQQQKQSHQLQQLKLKQQFLYHQQQQQVQSKQKQQQHHLQALQQQKQLQQQQQQQRPNDASAIGHVSTSMAAPKTTTTAAAAAATTTNQRRIVPHAYALYDFESNEPTDLHFKKGDLIMLKRKVDVNWFVGELNGAVGTFPTNYVQIIVPLPTPQCIALYDFKMGPNEEEGCLNFKKGTLIHVLRRVDHNWAEGRIGPTIGIFPIAFVELNTLAKHLLDSFHSLNPSQLVTDVKYQHQMQKQQQHNQQQLQIPTNISPQMPVNLCNNAANVVNNSQQQQRSLPPIPSSTNLTTVALNTPPKTTTTVTAVTNTTAVVAAAAAIITTTATTSSSSTSAQTSPTSNSNSSSGSTSSSLPSSPVQSNPTSPHNSYNLRYRNCKEKRHSLNALLSHSSTAPFNSSSGIVTALPNAVPTSNRHSAEILSIPNADTTTTNAPNTRMRSSANDISLAGLTTKNASSSSQVKSAITEHSMAATTRANILKTATNASSQQQHAPPPILPWGYLALYPYKPRKSDELELKKGCVYVVTERCLDGWFKGKNWQDIAGVFPGNYVTPLRNRDQQQLMHQWRYVQNTAPQQNKLNVAMNKDSACVVTTPHQPPELPPRLSPSNLAAPPATVVASSSVWSKPLGHTVEAFFSRKLSQHHHLSDSSAPETRNTTTKGKECDKQKDGNTQCGSSSGSSTSASSAAVNLMKRLTHIKTRSKSPNNGVTLPSIVTPATKPTYSMDNPSFEDSPALAASTAHASPTFQLHIAPVHVRSGSCPSQLLQSLPATDLLQSATKQQQLHNKQHSPLHESYESGSQRIKGCKERPQILNIRQAAATVDATTRGIAPPPPLNNAPQLQVAFDGVAAAAHQHRKTQSLDASSISAQIKKPISKAPKDSVRESLTVQSIGRESRFRCIVSYPSNSEHELDLQVGDVVHVHRKQKNGWYKGTHARTKRTGLFPASFVEPDI